MTNSSSYDLAANMPAQGNQLNIDQMNMLLSLAAIERFISIFLERLTIIFPHLGGEL